MSRYLRHCFLPAILLGVFFASQTVWAEKPIPNGEDALTDAAWRKTLLKHWLEWIPIYRKTTKDDPKVRDAAANFIKDVLTKDALELPLPEWNALANTGKKTLAAQSHDPFVQYCLGIACLADDDIQNAKLYYKQSVDGLPGTSYPCELQYLIYDKMHVLFVQLHDQNGWTPYEKKCLELADRLFVESVSRPKERRFFVVAMLNLMLQELPRYLPGQKTVSDAAAKATKIDPWLQHLLQGYYYLRQAWHDRGSGYANTVTEAGWKSFHKNLKIAGEHFKKAWEIDPTLPAAPSRMMSIAMANGDDLAVRDWFDRTVAAQMDYSDAYNAMLWALRPRWGGSHGKMYKFGLECMETERYDTDVPFRLISVILQIDDELGNRGEAWRRPGVYKNAKQVFDNLEKAYIDGSRPMQENVYWDMMTLHAVAAIHAKEFTDARQLLEKIGEKLREQHFSNHGLKPRVASSLVFAMTGKASEQVAEFQSLVEENKFDSSKSRDAALKLLNSAVTKDSNVHAKPYYDYWKTRLSWQQQFERGEWVNLEFGQGFLMWQISRKTAWHAENSNSAISTGQWEGHDSVLMCDVKFAVPIEVECNVELINNSGTSELLSGIVLEDSRDFPPDLEHSREFWIDVPRNSFGAMAHWRKLSNKIAPAKSHKLWLRLWKNGQFEFHDGNVQLDLGNKQEVSFLNNNTTFTPDGRISLHDRHIQGNATVRFSNLRVRKLTLPSPPDDKDYKARLEFYNESLRQHPDIAYAHYSRGVAFSHLNRKDEADADWRKALKLQPSLRLTIGIVSSHLRNYRLAIECYEQVLREDSKNPYCLNGYAHLLATASEDKYRNGEKAVEYAKKACELSNYSNAYFLDTLAAAMAEAGKFDEAVQWQEQAIAKLPKTTTASDKKECVEALKLYKAKKPWRDSNREKKKTN